MENAMTIKARDVKTGMQVECPDGLVRKVAWTATVWWTGSARGKHGREICMDGGYTVRVHGSSSVIVIFA